MSVLNLNLPQGILRGSLGHYSPILACTSTWCGVMLGDFNRSDLEEGWFNVRNQIFTDCDQRKTAVFHSFHATLRFPIWLHHERRHGLWCHTHSFKDWSFLINLSLGGTWFSTARLRLLRTLGRTFSSPIWFFSCSNFMTSTDSRDPLCALAGSFKSFCIKPWILRHWAIEANNRASGQSFWSLLLLYVLVEIYIWGHSCDVVKLGNLLKIALIYFGVLISSDIATFLLALVLKTFRHVKLRSPPSLGRKQKQCSVLM